MIIVNHALLLADLALKDMGLQGVIPSYDRIVLDEAHHLEDAATGAISKRLTYRAIARAIAPLLSRRRRRGALERLVLAATQPRSGSEPPVTGERADRLRELASTASDQLQTLRTEARVLLEDLADSALSAEQPTLRITRGLEHSPRWRDELEPSLQALIGVLGEGLAPLSQILKELDGVRLPEDRVQPLFDVRRAERRFGGFLEVLHGFGEHDHDTCRWLEGQRRRRGSPTARLVMAPIDVSATLRRILWHRIAGTTSTSATMTIAGRFGHWMTRTGLREAEEALFPSPFDHAQQALLALPRDLPVPDAPGWLGRSIDVTIDAVRLSEGGTFVLCTSYQAVEAYAAALREALPASWPVLVQTRGGLSLIHI